jgi:predicted DNA binding protein
MSVIIELNVPAGEFELGRVLELQQGGVITVDTMVPMGENAIPFFTVHDDVRETFEKSVGDHPTVTSITRVNSSNGSTLFALDWDVSRDRFFEALSVADAHILEATGHQRTWSFELRFPSHDALTEFQKFCDDANITLDIKRVYNPTKPDAGPWYGLTHPQRQTLTRAVEGGYYSIPRKLSTKELAAEFDISDQAVTERLRRAIVTLVENTLLESETKESAAAED